MKFAKTLVAAALLASAGAANAKIAYNTAASELFLQVYDQSRGLTYDLDLGKSNTVTLNNLAAFTSALHYDLSADSNWQTFVSGMDVASTKFGVVAGYSTSFMFTSNDEPLIPGGIITLGQTTTAIKNQAGYVNTGMGTNTAQDLSRLVNDADTAKTGQWAAAAAGANPLTTLYGTFGDANAAIAYGATGNFLYEAYNGVTKSNEMKTLGGWTLSANSLDFSTAPAPAAVPLPAAVWMFGAGLMGVLRLTRRKSAAI